MEELQTQIMQQTLTVIGTLLAALLSWASAEAIRWIRQKRKAGYVQDLAVRFITIADIVVARGMQKQVKKARLAAEDGKLTKAEGKRLLDSAVKDVLDYASQQMVQDAERVIDPVTIRKLAEDAVEAAVYRYKQKQGGES